MAITIPMLDPNKTHPINTDIEEEPMFSLPNVFPYIFVDTLNVF